MTSEQRKTFEALWREAFAKGLVRWMPGMRRRDGCVVVHVGRSGQVYAVREHTDWIGAEIAWIDPNTKAVASHLPVPDDPATVGCILAMAREVVDDPGLHVEWCDGDGWTCWLLFESSATEPEALMRAILEGGARDDVDAAR